MLESARADGAPVRLVLDSRRTALLGEVMGKRKHTDRAPKPAQDLAVFTVVLNRETGEVHVEHEPTFVRKWEIEFAIETLAESEDDYTVQDVPAGLPTILEPSSAPDLEPEEPIDTPDDERFGG